MNRFIKKLSVIIGIILVIFLLMFFKENPVIWIVFFLLMYLLGIRFKVIRKVFDFLGVEHEGFSGLKEIVLSLIAVFIFLVLLITVSLLVIRLLGSM